MPKSTTMTKSTFNLLWCQDKSFSSWVQPVKGDIYNAYCSLCNAKISLSNMGKTALLSHMKGRKHIALSKNKEKSCLTFTHTKIVTLDAESIKTSEEKCYVCEVAPQQLSCMNACALHCKSSADLTQPLNILDTQFKGVKRYLVNDQTTNAQVILCLHSIIRHYSLRDIESTVQVMKTIFPDSEIAKKIRLSKTKVAYTTVYGLAPYFQRELESLILNCDKLVIGFDESLNKISQREQMDIMVRFWNEEKDEVSTRYYTSVFLGHTCANDLLNAFEDNVPKNIIEKIIQISMDGPNVNHKFVRDLQTNMAEDLKTGKLLDLGTCGLHTLHGAFKTAIKATGWSLIEFLRALYNLFKNVPARRADYSAVSSSTLFPKKFCAIRWLENVAVVERARKILPNIQQYVNKVVKDKKAPKTAAFQTVLISLNDKLLNAKLAVFQSFASELEPFLREFQTNKPYAPFLHDALLSIISTTAAKFMKPEVLKDSKLYNIDYENKENLLSVNNTHIGYATMDAMRHVKEVTTLEITRFKNDCRTCFQTFLNKLMQRSPVKFPLVKAISCLDPSVALQRTVANHRLANAMNIFVNCQKLSGICADKVDHEYRQICSLAAVQEAFKNFNRSDMRLDHFWVNLIAQHGVKNYSNLLSFIKSALILAHGNADLERGFSFNKEMLIENQNERSLIAQRSIHDALTANGQQLHEFVVTKKLLHAARNAHSFYKEELTKEKGAAEEQRKMQGSQKRVAKALKELEIKKRKVMEEAIKTAACIDDEMLALKRQ